MAAGRDRRRRRSPAFSRLALNLARVSRLAGPVLAAIFGVFWFAQLAGGRALDPTNNGWVLTGEDWSTHALGWWFFRIEAWTFPLGRLDGLMHPVGTSVAYTDSIPLVATLLKPLSPLLPEAFHYLGLWLAFCFAANAFSGAWMVRRLGGGLLAQLGAGALLATTPVFLPRLGHEALCAHFLIVVPIALHLEAPRPWPQTRRTFVLAGLMVALAGGIHPYLAAMVLPLAIALPIRSVLFDRVAPPLAAVVVPTAYVAVLFATFLLFGYLDSSLPSSAEGFGWWNADLWALFNSRGFSRLLPALPSGRPHHEGFGYLGVGVLALIPLALILAVVRRARASTAAPLGEPSFSGSAGVWRYLPLVVVAMGALVFALASEVKAGPHTLFRAEALFRHTEPLNTTFRASGRFVWVLHYTLSLAAIAAVVRGFAPGRMLAGIILLAAATLQAADTKFERRGLFQRRAIDAGLRAELWSELGAHYRHLALVPPQQAWVGEPCEGELPGHLRYPFGYLAYSQRMTFNSSSPARKDPAALKADCARVRQLIQAGEFDPQTVYVARAGHPSAKAMRRSGSAQCGEVDGYDVCVSAGRETPLREALSRLP